MSDLIDRQDTIDAMEEAKKQYFDRRVIIGKMQDIVNNLPSAEPERKKGKWIDYSEDGFVECPFCHSATNCEGNKDELHYCFCCGADMRRTGDSSDE